MRQVSLLALRQRETASTQPACRRQAWRRTARARRGPQLQKREDQRKSRTPSGVRVRTGRWCGGGCGRGRGAEERRGRAGGRRCGRFGRTKERGSRSCQKTDEISVKVASGVHVREDLLDPADPPVDASAGLAPNSEGAADVPPVEGAAAPKRGFGASAGLLAAGAPPKRDGAAGADEPGAALFSAGFAPNRFKEAAASRRSPG